jgi:hypothetical protein
MCRRRSRRGSDARRRVVSIQLAIGTLPHMWNAPSGQVLCDDGETERSTGRRQKPSGETTSHLATDFRAFARRARLRRRGEPGARAPGEIPITSSVASQTRSGPDAFGGRENGSTTARGHHPNIRENPRRSWIVRRPYVHGWDALGETPHDFIGCVVGSPPS